MASQEQIEANRRNAQKSTGPKTPGGKTIAARNGATHGLTSAREIVLKEENTEEFRQLLGGFRDQYQPQGRLEDFLVRELAAADWRLRRITRLETGFLAHRLSDLREQLDMDELGPDPDDTPADQQCAEDTELMGTVFWRNCAGDAFVKLVRYESAVRRAFYKALHELKLVQSRRPAPAAPNIKIDEPNPISLPDT